MLDVCFLVMKMGFVLTAKVKKLNWGLARIAAHTERI